MNKYQDLKCFFGLHNFEVYKEIPLTDVRGNAMGKIIVSRCTNCGKIKQVRVITVNGYI